MMTVWAVALGLLALAALPFRNIITDMCQREAQTRLGQVPVVLLRLAARRVPREWRDDFHAEWLAELSDIRLATSEVPVTGLVRQVLFALSLLVHARAVAREFTGERLPWIPRPPPRGISMRRALASARRRMARSLRPGLAPASPRISGGGAVSLRWPVALVATAALAAASTFFIMSLTQKGAGPQSPGIPSAAAGTLDPHYLSVNVPVASSELLADDTGPSTARMLTADVEAELKKLAPGRSAGFMMVFAPSPTRDIAQGITAASLVVGILRTNDPEEFKYAVGEGFWTGDSQEITIRVFLLQQPRPGS
jgi:hypothetical protein